MVEPESRESPLITADRLAALLDRADVVVVDGSWHLPSAGRDADREYLTAHIPGAVRMRLDDVSDATSDLPHMVPPPELFAAECGRLGISSDSTVVVYDTSSVNLSAARIWWLFRVFGHSRVFVLDGGFGAWASATRPVQRGEVTREPGLFPVRGIRSDLVVDMAGVNAIVTGETVGQIVDCRPAVRFRGEVAEPRPGLRSGHIPGSSNIPFSAFTDPATGLFVAPERIAALLAAQGLDLSRRIVASCGSGTSACVLALAVEVLRAAGRAPTVPVAIYDGSWAEYGRITG